MAKTKIAIYIGRFQPLHLGHCHVLDTAFKKYDAVIILVGSAEQARDPKNPFSFEERKTMIDDYLTSIGQCKYVVTPLRNHLYNNPKWMQTVQEKVDEAIFKLTMSGFINSDDVDLSIIGSDRDDSTWYIHAFPQYGKPDLVDPVPVGQKLNATSLRARLFTDGIGDPWDDVPKTTLDFLVRFIMLPASAPIYIALKNEYRFLEETKKQYAGLKYAPFFVTTDAVVIQSGHVLVIERAALPGVGLLALPGGYLHPQLTLFQNSIKELLEETGIRLVTGKRSKEITEQILRASFRFKEQFDAPDRSLRGRIVTTAFLYQLDDTKPLPAVFGMNAPLDETDGVAIPETVRTRWMPISEALNNPQLWFEDHYSMLEKMIGMMR